MADNYLLFSAPVDANTEEELCWLVDTAMQLYVDQEWPSWAREMIEFDPEDLTLPEFTHYDSDTEKSLVIYSQDNASPEAVVPLVQKFFQRFRPHGIFHLCWATTCSRPRVGEFGGGAVFITAESVEWMSTWSWAEEQKASAFVQLGDGTQQNGPAFPDSGLIQ